ncbi:MAG TPA: hypothetical protein VGI20_05135, partial [Rhizomicrobium sp.]
MVTPLLEGSVVVWWMNVDKLDDEMLARWRGILENTEQVRADRFHFAQDRDTFVAAHALKR